LIIVPAAPDIFSRPAGTRYRSNSLPLFQKNTLTWPPCSEKLAETMIKAEIN
jgi:hypothetical protein